MMEDHFGFSTSPFTRELPIDKRLSLPFLETQIDYLEAVVSRRMSGVLMAPAGSGKTVCLRGLRARLPEARYRASYLKVPELSGRDLCREIARAVGARTAGNFPALVRSVQERFEQDVGTEGIRPVLLIDDAHALKPQGMTLLKIITNFSMDSRLVVSIVLAGHPSLKEKLYQSGCEDIRQRLSHCGELRLLSRDECQQYIEHRIAIAGGRKSPFDAGSIEALFEVSRGNMRAVDEVARKALDKAAIAKADAVSQQHVAAARAELWV